MASPFEFSLDLFHTQQPRWMGLHVSALNFPPRRSRLRWIKAAQIGIQLAESVIEGHFTFGNKKGKVNVCPHKYERFCQVFPEM